MKKKRYHTVGTIPSSNIKIGEKGKWLDNRRYQTGNQKPQIEGQTIQWPKRKKRQKDKQWSAKHYTENKRSINITDESYFNHNWTFLIFSWWLKQQFLYSSTTKKYIKAVMDKVMF
jgi:hypothetical protein